MTKMKHADKLIGRKVKYLKKDNGVICKIATDMRSRLVSRTKDGKDHKGSGFTGYAESTKKQKRELGRDTNLVDLTDTNTMLKGVAVGCHRNYAMIYAGARTKVGMKHQKGMGLPKRAWFGYTKNSEKKARKDYEKHLNKAIRK